MSWLQYVGDTDILRDATRSTTVFWHRIKQGWKWDLLGLLFTLTLGASIAILALGPERSGLPWASLELFGSLSAVLAAGWLTYVGWLVFKFMPGRNDRVVLALRQFVRRTIDPLEKSVRALSEEQLKAKTAEFRQRLADGQTLDDIRAEAYACVREASRRAKEHRQFECQLIGGKILEENNVAEMRTGEGKTIVCYLGNYMKVLQGKKVHMVTTNDFLVKRDAEFARPIFELLDVSVGYITADMDTYGPGVEVRRDSYGCNITYGMNSEFGFDYLRDNMKHSVRDQVQSQQHYVVVDEVDSILIDEARTPLIISGPAHDDIGNYRVADDVARELIRKQEQANRQTSSRLDELEKNPPPEARQNPKFNDAIPKFRKDPYWLSSEEAEAIGHMQYFVVELDRKSSHMTEHGAKAAQSKLGIGTFYDSVNMNWPHYIDNALRAHLTYQRDRDYVVQEDKVTIVDEFTGRLMHGRQWSDGLHQAVEAKERVTIKQESQTLATITLQNLFKLYEQLAGMTGTAMTESEEFMKIYKLEVIAVPTNRPIRRIDYNDKIYKSVHSKFDAIVEEIRSHSQDGCPNDPFSLQDTLKIARHTAKGLKAHGESEGKCDEWLRIIEEATAASKDDENALAEGYRKLMGGELHGRPVLVGTASVENSEKISELLTRRYGVEHEVLNAKNHAREADIVAKAGQQHEQTRGKRRLMVGNVTISTNMAGRGTDIRLGASVAEAGGLHVVGTERHESRRIDNQLRGRCGRQGDPGSSRFFLSLEDDLLRLFMGEWMLKMFNLMGFQEGEALENKRLTKGIEKAQKRVEERNFGIRKNLLEYDEVMDYQRKRFYAMRQQVVEGRGLSDLIWDAIDDTVGDAIDRYYNPKYAASCVGEWVALNLGAAIDSDKLDTSDFKAMSGQVRDLAGYEVRSTVSRTFGEYIDNDIPPEEWDVRGFSQWAGNYGFTISQNQVRKENPEELRERLIEAATKTIENADLTPLEQYCDAMLPKQRLVQWAKDKFDVDIPVEEITKISPQQTADVEQLIRDKMRAAYRIREIEYPVGAVIDFALQRGGANAIEVGEIIARWANRKYNVDWTYERFMGRSPDEVFKELRSINEDYLTNGKLDREIDDALKSHKGDALLSWARERFGAVAEIHPINLEGDTREQLRQCGYEMLRFELTQLERHVLLTTLDAIWKDHMYAMDILRHGIGLRGYAERDPKIEYKREGTRLFNEMMGNIRERVTDLIFKVRIAGFAGGDTESGAASPGPRAGAGPAFANAQASKADATNIGLSSAAADQEAAMRKQGEGAQQHTIRREAPKVGRNDPCPCGSGKKYKKCCGKDA